MMGNVRRHMTYANVISTLCLFVLLGGGAYAAGHLKKDSVKSKQIKAGAVKNAELADGAVDGVKLADGAVSGVKLADGAVNTSKLTDGAVAGSKLADGTVDSVKIADQSIDAEDLKPSATASLKDGCPSGMTQIGNVVCIDKQARGSGDWTASVTLCANAKLRLPSPSEAWAAFQAGVGGGTARIWTDAVDGAGNNSFVTDATWVDENFSAIRSSTTSTSLDTYCARPPGNG